MRLRPNRAEAGWLQANSPTAIGSAIMSTRAVTSSGTSPDAVPVAVTHAMIAHSPSPAPASRISTPDDGVRIARVQSRTAPAGEGSSDSERNSSVAFTRLLTSSAKRAPA